MPRVKSDPALLSEVNAVVEQCGGTVSAARILGVDRTILWRFIQTGRAIQKTKTTLQNGLKQFKYATHATENATNPAMDFPLPPTQQDIQKLRQFLRQALVALDAYEIYMKANQLDTPSGRTQQGASSGVN